MVAVLKCVLGTISLGVHDENGGTDHADILGCKTGGAAGPGMALGLLGLVKDCKELSRLSLICRERLVLLKASRSTSLKASAIFCFITVDSKAGLWNPVELRRNLAKDHRVLQAHARTIEQFELN